MGDVVTSITNWPPPVFPRVVKCNMPYIGPGGSIREHNSICTLAYSALHEKIYIVVISLLMLISKNLGPQEFSELMNKWVENKEEAEEVNDNDNSRMKRNCEEQSRLKHY